MIGLKNCHGKGDRTMAEYHVGCGLAGIYAGTLNKKGDMWLHKSDVTNEVLGCAAQHLLFNKTEFRFQYKDKSYVLRVEGGQDG